MGLSAETPHSGTAGRLMRASKILTAAGCRSRPARRPQPDRGRAERPGADGRVGRHPFRGSPEQHSAQDPKYTVVPSGERLDRGAGRR